MNTKMLLGVIPKLATAVYAGGLATSLQTAVAPASNTKGILVNYAKASALQANQRTRIMTKSSAPSSVDDAAANTIAFAEQASINYEKVERPILIPPGLGLYYQTTDAASTGRVILDYEVLT